MLKEKTTENDEISIKNKDGSLKVEIKSDNNDSNNNDDTDDVEFVDK